MVQVEVNKMRSDFTSYQTKTNQDLEALELKLIGYTDSETDTLKKSLIKKIDDATEQVKYEAERLRAEFELFKSKDHKELEARVTALE